MSDLPSFFQAAPNVESDDDSSSESYESPVVQPVLYQPPAPYTPAPVQIQPSQTDILQSQEKFWDFVALLNWRDRSEDPNFSTQSAANKLLRLSISDRDRFRNWLNEFIDELIALIDEKGLFPNLGPEQKRAFCSHIIGKGQIFYAMTVSDCNETGSFGFASYLADSNDYRNMLAILP